MLSGVSEDAGSCREFFAAVLHRSVQISWILCQNTSNASVNVANISCCIHLSKVRLLPWKDSSGDSSLRWH